jgi:hypothetical protein
MTTEKAMEIAIEAKTIWCRATTRDEGARVITIYGGMIGYKPLVKILCNGEDMRTTLDKIYGEKK